METDKTITAHGQARTHYWGEFCATLHLKFDTHQEAEIALPKVRIPGMVPGVYRDACGGIRAGVDWELMPEDEVTPAGFLIARLADPALELVLDHLESLGADRSKILSCARSIDHGEPFTVTIPI